MKIGVSAFAWTTNLNSRHLGLLPGLREHGIEGFEIPMFDPARTAATEIRRAVEANDMDCTVCAILPEGINPISPDAATRKRSHAHLLQCVETAAEAGAHLIGGPLYAPVGYLPGRRRNQDEWNWAVECFQALGDVLSANEMTLSIEPVNRSETFFLCNAAEAGDLCKAIDHPCVGITIDTFHANIEEKDLAAAVKTSGKLLKHMHASENDRGLLGSGHVDFPAIVAALNQIDYDGYVTIEGFGYSTAEPDCLGALWGDLSVSPEDIAFQGAKFLSGLISSVLDRES
jgi:D-psicose/D-tagatose/L-ribulose 3-epimerase